MKKDYIKTRPKTVVDVTKIVTIHYYEVGKNFTFDGEKHDFWELVYVDKGSVAIRRDHEEETVFSQGEVIFHRPNEFHTIRAYNSVPNFFVISFVSSSLSMVHFERFCTSLNRIHKSLISSIIKEAEKSYHIPKNDPTLRRLRRRSNAPLGSEQLIKNYLEQLLIYLLRTKEKSENIAVPMLVEEQPLVVAIKEYISNRCEEKIRVDEICSAFGYSKSFLSRLFREHTGESLSSFAEKCKLQRAKELLRDDTLNITQISVRLSFDNPQYFARVFRRVYGMTPTEWKRLARI